MYTYILNDDQVWAYLKDYVDRYILPVLIDPSGKGITFIVLGSSGHELYRFLSAFIHGALTERCCYTALEKFHSEVASTMIVSSYDRLTGQVTFRDDDGSLLGDEFVVERLCNREVILIDSAVHSGRSMQAIADAIIERSPASISSYTLFLKRSSSFIPNFFGVVINDTDRALFLLDKLSNSRFNGKIIQHGIEQHIIRGINKSKDVKYFKGKGLPDQTISFLVDGEQNMSGYRGVVVETPHGELVAGMGYHEKKISGNYMDIRGVPQEVDNADTLVVDRIWARWQRGSENRSGHYRQGLLRWAETQARSVDKKFVMVSMLGAKDNPFGVPETIDQLDREREWWGGEGYPPLMGYSSDEYVIRKIC